MATGLKKGDNVFVLAGKDKGKTGRILKIFSAKNRAIVEGVNLVKKHMRRRSENEPGGIKEIPSSVNLSNLALFCPNCSRPVRFSVKVLADKTKVRICKKCQKEI